MPPSLGCRAVALADPAVLSSERGSQPAIGAANKSRTSASRGALEHIAICETGIAYTRFPEYMQSMIDRLAQIHKALADETRLRILYLLLAVGDLCGCDVETALGISQSKASRHLQTLKQAGFVADHRDATWVYYRIPKEVDAPARNALLGLLEVMEADPRARADAQRARELRRSPRCALPATWTTPVLNEESVHDRDSVSAARSRKR